MKNKVLLAGLAVVVFAVATIFIVNGRPVQTAVSPKSAETPDAPKQVNTAVEHEVAKTVVEEITHEPTLTQKATTEIKVAPVESQPRPTRETSDTPPLLLKSIGINLDDFDPTTGRAGDFLFTKQKLTFNRLFMPFGFVIPADTSSTGKSKTNPQPTFIVPLGTPVRSLVDGIVVNTPTLWSGDVSIQVTENGKLEKWVYETEHVMNPTVHVGDRVTAGQIVGEASNFDKGAPEGFATVEIGILKGGNPPEHVCPFAYLDPSIKDETLRKMNAVLSAWEAYTGNSSLYDETWPVSGCNTLNPIEG